MSRRREEPKLIIVGQETPVVQSQPAPAPRKPIRLPVSFDAWWLLKQTQVGLKPELKEAVRRHFESRGFMQDSRFDEGLRDFGI